MFTIYVFLLVLISSGFSLPDVQLSKDNRFLLSTPRNSYPESLGFKPTSIKDYPFLASVAIQTLWLPAGPGVIINKHWVLYPAYCSEFLPSEIKIYVGTNNGGRSGQHLDVSKIIPHEKFARLRRYLYNIALLKTDKPMTFNDKVKPVKLANSIPKAGTDCTLLGYGYLQDKPFVGWDLGVATVQIKPQDQCQQEHGPLKFAYCAAADDVVPCYGDIGDALVYKDKLVGLYILGGYCNTTDETGVFTNVPAFKKWIWNTIKKNSNDDEMEGLLENQFFED